VIILLCFGKIPNREKPESKKDDHENAKFGKHENFIFRVFVISCFRDKKVLKSK